MKIVKFKGGLGNQMFQYAFLRLLQIKYNEQEIKGDFFYYKETGSDIIRQPRLLGMNVQLELCSEEELKKILLFKRIGSPLKFRYKTGVLLEWLFNSKYYFEQNRTYRNIDKIIHYQYFDGYWQNWKYLSEIETELRSEFTQKEELSSLSKEKIDYVSKHNTVFVGVRRGDYLSSKKMIEIYGETDIEYYKKAMAYMCDKLENPLFMFFSNDLEWVKENMTVAKLGLNGKCHIEYSEDVYSDLEELYVMGNCRHAIISNSTFNYWGAWLIDNKEKIVIAPKEWFKDGTEIDIVPDTWIKM